MAAVIRAVLGGDWSHGGIKRGPKTFEHRWRCGFYDWSPEYTKPEMRVRVYRPIRASESVQAAAFYITEKSWKGKVYGARQAFTMGRAALWARAGIHLKIRPNDVGVCTEVVWCAIDALGGYYQRHLHHWHQNQDRFTPLDEALLFAGAPDLYERIL